MIEFPISGVETYWWLPIVVSFVISFFAATAGLSGAFLLLPFQMSVLGFIGPAVSSTNLFFNAVAIPSGVYQFVHEKRMVWSLAWVITFGTLPGILIGAILRIKYLPNPRSFKLFVGLVLFYIGIRLIKDIVKNLKTKTDKKSSLDEFKVKSKICNIKTICYEFNNQDYSASTLGILVLSFIVGIIGGTYGIGGGAIVAPFLVAVLRLPVYTTAGATLFSTFVASIFGVMVYYILSLFYTETNLTIQPDWLLGFMFGIGGAAGIYLGARVQRFIPAKIIKMILTFCLFFVALKYIIGFWF